MPQKNWEVWWKADRRIGFFRENLHKHPHAQLQFNGPQVCQNSNTSHDWMVTWMSGRKLGSMVRINGLLHLLMNRIYWEYNPHTNLLLTSWGIQVDVLDSNETPSKRKQTYTPTAGCRIKSKSRVTLWPILFAERSDPWKKIKNKKPVAFRKVPSPLKDFCFYPLIFDPRKPLRFIEVHSPFHGLWGSFAQKKNRIPTATYLDVPLEVRINR